MSPGAGTGREALLTGALDHFARHGIVDTSLRALAEAIGTSHRMLIYHFGSREGLLAAVVDRVEADARVTATELMSGAADPVSSGLAFWQQVTERALVYGPLFFELSSHAMLGLAHATELRDRLVTTWLDTFTELWVARGTPRDQARRYARQDVAMARGLLYDVLVTGDRAGVDDAMAAYARDVVGRRPDGAG